MKTDCMKEVGSVIILILERPLLSDDTIFPLLACNDDQIVRNLISVYCNNSHWLCIFIFQVLSGSMPLPLLFFCFGLVWFGLFFLFYSILEKTSVVHSIQKLLCMLSLAAGNHKNH